MAFRYVMSATGKAFHESDKYVKMLCGPFGSGKSCCCAIDVLANACAQTPSPIDNVRYSRVGVIRSTYPELLSTTRKSLLEVLPPECGSITGAMSPLRGTYIIPLRDGTTVHMELVLLAIQNEADEHKLRSMNLTFIWINEATGVTSDVFSLAMTRTGRYPSQDHGGARWGGILMDFNQPVRGSWLDVYMKNPEKNWGVFLQPPAAFQTVDAQGNTVYQVNPDAENLRNLGAPEEGDPPTFTPEERGLRYYRNQIATRLKEGREDIVMNQYCMLDVPVIEGKPVYSNFNKAWHVAPYDLDPVMFQPIILGVDQSGIHPAAVVLQQQKGRWCVLDELWADKEGLEDFLLGMLVPLLRSKYATNPVSAALDPSNQRDSWQAITPKQRFENVGIPAVTEISNSPKIRIQMVEHMLNLHIGGLLVSPHCELLINGFVHEYRYRKLRAGGTTGAAYTPAPEKNEASHVHDALQYAALLIHMGLEDDSQYDHVFTALAAKRRVLSQIV